MNVGVSTIEDMFGQTAGPVSALPRPEASERRDQSPLRPAETQAPADIASQTPSQRDPSDIRPEPSDKGRENFNEVIRKKTKPADTQEAPNSNKPTEPDAKPEAAAQPSETQTWLAQHSMAAQLPQKAVGEKVESKAGEPQPTAGEAAAPTQLNIVATAAKNQSGLQTVTPDTFKPTAAVITQPAKSDNAGTIPIPNDTVPGTKGVVKGADAKELMPEGAVDTAGKATSTDTKPVIAETPATVGTPTAPASNAKDLPGETVADGNARPAPTGEKTAVATDLPAMAQAKPSPKQFIAVDAQESAPTAETEANAGAAQTRSKSPALNSRKPALNNSQGSNGSDSRQVNAAAVEAATGQAEGGDGSNSNGSLNSGSEQTLSHTAPATPIEQPATAFAVNAKAASPPEQTPAGNQPPSVGDQILDSVRSSLSRQAGDKQITIQLNPPELGKVSLKFQEQGAQITGVLEVSNAQTRLEIEQALPQIIRSLAESGVEVRRIEVVLSEDGQSQQQASKDPLLQGGSSQQHNSANSDSSPNQNKTPGTYYKLANNGGHQSAVELREMATADGSIDILV